MTSPSATPATSPASGGDLFEGTSYRKLSRLASGGMGEVYLVVHSQLGRTFAAKVLHARLAADARLVERARIEAQSLARLRHANIVAVSGFGFTKDQRPYIVMEYLRGRTLDAELKICGVVPVLDAVRFMTQLLSALEAAHELGIVHRDIKPSNIFLCDPHDNVRLLKVLDFGVVRVLPNASEQAPEPPAVPTESGVLIGTPRYLSPEGAMGQRVDARADLYAAALMLFYMLTGRGPFDEIDRDTAVLAAHAHQTPPAPSLLSQQRIPRELDLIVLKALRKEPEARFQTAAEFKTALERFAAILLCPPGLRETAVVGAIGAEPVSAEEATGDPPMPVPSKSAVMRKAERVAPVGTETAAKALKWRALAVFLFFGLVMAVIVAWMERSP